MGFSYTLRCEAFLTFVESRVPLAEELASPCGRVRALLLIPGTTFLVGSCEAAALLLAVEATCAISFILSRKERSHAGAIEAVMDPTNE